MDLIIFQNKIDQIQQNGPNTLQNGPNTEQHGPNSTQQIMQQPQHYQYPQQLTTYPLVNYDIGQSQQHQFSTMLLLSNNISQEQFAKFDWWSYTTST